MQSSPNTSAILQKLATIHSHASEKRQFRIATCGKFPLHLMCYLVHKEQKYKKCMFQCHTHVSQFGEIRRNLPQKGRGQAEEHRH